jgi:DNA polymerase III delta prime subunit
MNSAEARLALHEKIHDFMVDLAIDEDMSVEEIAETEESMNELVEMLLDTIQCEITEVNDDSVLLTVSIAE